MAPKSNFSKGIQIKCGDKEWILENYINCGSFGELWVGRFASGPKKGLKVAVKFETLVGKDGNENMKPQLPLEWAFYKKLVNEEGNFVPEIHNFFKVPKTTYHCLVMQYLGKSLESRLSKCGGKFSLKTTLQLAIKIINCIEFVHNRGIIHRDIKPDNFMFGHPDEGKEKQLYIIDFGLAKEWKDEETGKHIPYKATTHILGTQRYMSIHAHIQMQQSRRDDLESIGYMLVYFVKGHLPWENVGAPTKSERNHKIGHIKMKTTPESLVGSGPSCLTKYLNYVKGLHFEQTPNYDDLRYLFCRYAERNHIFLDDTFEWDPPSQSSVACVARGSTDSDERSPSGSSTPKRQSTSPPKKRDSDGEIRSEASPKESPSLKRK